MRTATGSDEGLPSGAGGRHPTAGTHRSALGATVLAVGTVAAIWTHIGAARRGSMVTIVLLVLLVLASTGAGVEFVVQAARFPARHVFRFGTLRLAAVALFVVAATHAGTVLWFDCIGQVWASGDLNACVVAGIGSVSAGIGTALYAVIATRLAWRAFLDEYWAPH